MKKPVLSRLTPAGVALLYAAFAAVWIAASGYLLTLAISDPLLHSRIELIKGLVFVAVTGMLLYLLLKVWSERLYADKSGSDAATVQANDTDPPKTTRLALVFMALVLIVPLIGLTVIKIYIPQEEQETYRNLEVTAKFKTEQIENWLDERRGNGEVLAGDAAFTARVEQFVQHEQDAELSKLILDRFDKLRSNYQYTKILLLNTDGRLLLVSGDEVTASAVVPGLWHQALASKQVQRRPIYRDEEGHIHLEWAVPLVVSDAQGERAVAVVVLRITAQSFIFPLIEHWPTASASGETLLVRRDGEAVLYLNQLRHNNAAPMTFRLPVSAAELPSAIAIRANQPGTVTGVDYQGVPVLAAYRPVAGTDWYIVAKLDRAEVLEPMWEMVYWISLIAFAAVIAIMAALLLLWRQQQRAQRLALVAQSAAATEKSERRFRAITQSARDAIITADSADNIISWNPSAERLFGYTATEIGGQPLIRLVPERYRDLHRECMEEVAAGEESHMSEKTVEFAGLRKGGSEFPLELSLAQWETVDGRFFTAIIRDITKRKAAESLLAEHELQYRTLADSGQALIWASGTDKLCNYFNKVWLDFTGRTIEQEMGNGWAEGVHPDDFQQCLDGYVAAFDLREKFSMDYRLRRHDGEYRWIQDDGCPRYDSAGEFIGYIGYCLDITERKQAEQKLVESEKYFRSLFENMLEGYAYCRMIFVQGVADDFIYLDVNRAFETLTGLKDVTGKNISEVIPGIHESNPELLEIYGRVALTGQPESFETYVGSLKIWFSISVYCPKKEYFVAVFNNITERKQVEAEILQLNEELEDKVAARTAEFDKARLEAEQANRSKSDFLAAMSHEIRTPMNGVIGMIDILQQSSLTGPQMEMANIIHDSAFSLLVVINDILDFSKIEAGKLQIEIAPMDAAGVVDGSCESLYQMALKKSVELTLFTDPAIPATVLGDAGRLRQILVNLANNAIKFSSGQDRPGKVSVRAVLVENSSHLTVRGEPDGTTSHSTRLSEDASQVAGYVEPHNPSTSSGRTVEGNLEQVTLEFRVTDNGIGIDEATRARLFTPFTQADTSTTRTYGGTGLGLVISRRLANIMGGEITVQSEPGKGSLFCMRVPFDLPQEPPTSESSSMVAGLTCLVVGSEMSLADDLAAYLAHDGAVVERSPDMVAARQWIVNRPHGSCIVVIDTADANPPLATSLLDGLRTATRPYTDVRFVAIERGGRRRCRVVATDLVELDAEIMHRRAFLEAVAIAAGRIKQATPEEKHGDTSVIPQLSREEARRRGSLILVAEDNEINQKVILQQLMLLGRTADIANNGREALERWQSGDYAILFADLHMPEMDGYGLTAAIRAAEKADTNKPRIPIIAFTANALKGEADHCRAIGMDDYLSKPVQLADLKAMLEKWMPVVSSDPIADGTASIPDVGRALPADEKICRAAPKAGNPLRDKSRVELTQPDLQHLPSDRGASSPVDVNVLKALIGDDEAMIREFLHDFRLSAAKIAAELHTACAAGQATAAGSLAHKLKSSSRSVGALVLGELCAAMEKAGKAADTAALAMLLPRFVAEIAAVDEYLGSFWKK